MKKLPFQKGCFFAIIEREGSYKEEKERKARGQLFRVNELARTNTKSTTTISHYFIEPLLEYLWTFEESRFDSWTSCKKILELCANKLQTATVKH